jgi:cytochrome c oxidase subunit 2
VWRVVVLCLSLAVAAAALPSGGEQVVHVTARKFAYEPSRIVVHRGVPVVLELTALDREHGFKLPALGLSARIEPGTTTELRFVPTTTGEFPFACNVFCGSGHDDMAGELVVVE